MVRTLPCRWLESRTVTAETQNQPLPRTAITLNRSSCLSRRRSRVRVRRSRHFRIADLSCRRCSLEILCGCQRQVATADSSLKPSRLMKTDQRECKCRKRAVRRESFTWSSVGSEGRGHLHRDNKVAGEKIGEQVSKRR